MVRWPFWLKGRSRLRRTLGVSSQRLGSASNTSMTWQWKAVGIWTVNVRRLGLIMTVTETLNASLFRLLTLRFDFITNSKVNHLRSINSKNTHINLFACRNMDISKIRMTAPASSPNTDGIHIGLSSNIKISRSVIQTGDDCISMVSGSRNIEINDVSCGPGHGISVGSLGRSHEGEYVAGISVRNCTFKGADNGLKGQDVVSLVV